MRIAGMGPQAAALLADSRTQGRGVKAGGQPRVAAPDVDPGPRLPVAVADRLAQLFAGDPGLAAAVTAQLPAARRDSARDMAGYATAPVPPHSLDITG
jgi:hypothetical protein